MNYRSLNAPELLKLWRSIVNKYTTGGRDLKLLKDALGLYTSPQILLGFYRNKDAATISIPQFLKQDENWLEEDETLAEIELCRILTSSTPPEYWEFRDNEEYENAIELRVATEALNKLREWSNKVLA